MLRRGGKGEEGRNGCIFGSALIGGCHVGGCSVGFRMLERRGGWRWMGVGQFHKS
jgi:hypothetical protein